MLICGSTNGKIYQFNTNKILANIKKQKKGNSEIDESLSKVPPQNIYKHFLIGHIIDNGDNKKGLTCF